MSHNFKLTSWNMYSVQTAICLVLMVNGTVLTTTDPVITEPASLRSHNNKGGQMSKYKNRELHLGDRSQKLDRNIDSVANDKLLVPQESNRGINCTLAVLSQSIGHFRHLVYYGDLKFVFLDLNFGANISFNLSNDKYIVGRTTWVWTYYGRQGALEFLKWPVEFGLWSMGLLYTYVDGPMKIDIERLSGDDCQNLQVGNHSTDLVISGALASLAEAMMAFDSERYGPSFWCYKKRIFIKPRALYMLCLHVVCPFEALTYSCCSYFYNVVKGRREIRCPEQTFKYDMLWWSGPIIIATILLGFAPILMLWLSWKLDSSSRKIGFHGVTMIDFVSTDNGAIEDGLLCDGAERNGQEDTPQFVYLDGSYHATLLSTVFAPCIFVVSKQRILCSRIFRCLLPLLSLSVVGLQILLDTYNRQGFIIESLNKGVPLGFRSMSAGYEMSRTKFLPYFGGPFVACGVYIFITMVFLVVPKSIADTLNGGLSNPERSISDLSPLNLNFTALEKFGSVKIMCRQGYKRIYSVYLAQFLMLINSKFWSFLVNLQISRWRKIPLDGPLRVIVLLFYVIACFVELLLCLLLYAFPLASFMLTIIRGYRLKLCGPIRCGGIKQGIAGQVFALLLIFTVGFFIYMFCSIFLDAFLFVARVFIFTYTGVVIYPKVSYGYLIFTFTVIYYLWDCIQAFNRTYYWLLKMTIHACEVLERADDGSRLTSEGLTSYPLTSCVKDCKGAREDIFEHVIEVHKPRRKQVLLSLIKVGVILTILYLSVRLLCKTDQLKELHVFMHVGTALFICAFPKIVKSMCPDRNGKMVKRRWLKKIIKTVREYSRNFVNDSSCTSDAE